ncbi:MAG: hypothetical protein Q7S16_04955 [bacterium]|nr:hypothetical protein [bacterium]
MTTSKRRKGYAKAYWIFVFTPSSAVYAEEDVVARGGASEASHYGCPKKFKTQYYVHLG